MPTETEPHAAAETREPPSQGVFIGWLGLGLLIFCIAWALTAILAGASHGFQ
jgi:hypothetical protein